jgi:CCR4-NOT transcription complex subunit 1
LILSAFPRTIRLPDPFFTNLKVDSIPETATSPHIMTEYLSPIGSIKQHLDAYMTTKLPPELPSKLPGVLLAVHNNGGVYNIQLITALIVYIGSVTIAQYQNNQIAFTNSNSIEIFKQLTSVVDYEGRYIILNAMANQLRYPNSHTHFFSFILLHLFAEAENNNEFLQEQITRVLLERLIVHRPHPVSILLLLFYLLLYYYFYYIIIIIIIILLLLLLLL